MRESGFGVGVEAEGSKPTPMQKPGPQPSAEVPPEAGNKKFET